MLKTKVILQKQDLRYLEWSKVRKTSGLAGSFLKAKSELEGKKLYYKLSNYDSLKGVVGIESVNELIVDRLLTILDVEHVHYQLVHADISVNDTEMETFLCVSEDFKNPNEDKTTLEDYFDIERTDEKDALAFCVNKGWEEYIYKMLVIDFIILNRDRPGANIEVLRNRKLKTIRLAPLFDHGLSLLFSCTSDEDVKRFDVMEDKPVNSFLGSKSTRDNLNLIPKDKLPVLNGLKESDKEVLFEDIHGILGEAMIDKIWDMIFGRWKWYEDFCNQGK